MAATARVVAGVVTLLTLIGPSVAGPAAAAELAAPTASAPKGLSVAITKVGDGAIHVNERLVVRGVVTNPGRTDWQDAQVYLQITDSPATSLKGLRDFADVPDNPGGLGNTLTELGLFDEIGDVGPGRRVPFKVSVPYDALGISSSAFGVYRVGVDVVAGSPAGRYLPGFRVSTLMPLLPPTPDAGSAEQSVILLPITAPVKRLADGAFADDSLRGLISAGGRLTNLLDWVSLAPPGTVQIVIDPALLFAITDMASGYVVRPPDPAKPDRDGQGQTEAGLWLQTFDAVKAAQSVIYLPWGGPAVSSLLAHHVPGPVAAAVEASVGYRDRQDRRSFVAGWLPNEGASIRAMSALRDLHTDLQILSQANLPALASYEKSDAGIPAQVTISSGGRQIPVLVAATDLAGLPTTPDTSALQLRQRLVADAAVRSLDPTTVPGSITVTALPFTWNPGLVRPSQGLTPAFDLSVLVAQSAIGALDRTGPEYRGAVRPDPAAVGALGTGILRTIHELLRSGGNLTAILNTDLARRRFQRTFAMAGAAQWRVYPLIGLRLISAQAAIDRATLSKVRITGPPFVAMSSNSGRFPLTITNGLGRAITVTIAVKPADPGLSIAPISPVRIDAGLQRDVQVVTTAEGSGVTSVRARLAVPDPTGGPRFGRAWRFDVRSTQIGLVIWIVMGIGGAVLFAAAGYRIVQRIRGNGPPRRQVPT